MGDNLKVLFSNINHQKKVESFSLVSKVPPLDLMYCWELVKNKCTAFILDANILDLKINQHISLIKRYSPDILVISFELYSVNHVKKIIESVGEDTKVILIGMFPTTKPEFCINVLGSDYVIIGEPEKRFEYLLDYFISKDKTILKNMDGLYYKKGNKTIKKKSKGHIKNLDSLPIPSRKFAFNNPFGIYRYENPFSDNITAIKAQRGCPFNCIYCDSHNLYGKKNRIRSTDNILEEIKSCVKQGIGFFSFLDHTFTVRREWCVELCRKIIVSGLKIKWIALTRVDCVDLELLKLMKKAGCVMLGYGIEKSSDSELKDIKKETNLQTIKKVLDLTQKSGILTMGYFIIGFPNETKKDISQIKRLIKKMDLDFIQLSFATPLPGTEFYDYCKENNLISDKNFNSYRFLQKSVLKTKLGKRRLSKARKEIISSFYLDPIRGVKRIKRIFALPISKKQVLKTTFHGFKGIVNYS